MGADHRARTPLSTSSSHTAGKTLSASAISMSTCFGIIGQQVHDAVLELRVAVDARVPTKLALEQHLQVAAVAIERDQARGRVGAHAEAVLEAAEVAQQAVVVLEVAVRARCRGRS